MNLIGCTTWVKKGVAALIPEKVKLKAEDLEKIIKETQSVLQHDDENSDEEASASTSTSTRIENAADEYNFENYDKESDNMYCHIGNIASFGSNGKDSFITDDNSNDSELEDDTIKSDDNLVLRGHIEGDSGILEIFVYNDNEGSFYCHHDILLPSIPMCLEWLNYDFTNLRPGNFCAVGSMTPIIDIWDLDLVDCLMPTYTLGCKPSKKKKRRRVGHRDAVLDVAWNQNYQHVLASGSVDQTVLLWDLDTSKPVTKFNSFNNMIQTLKWNPKESFQLLTGCSDKFMRLFDCNQEKLLQSWELSGEVEKVLWNDYEPHCCVASTKNGYIEYYDVRVDKPLWQIKAHEKEITGLSFSTSRRDILVSSSHDGVIKVWNLLDNNPVVTWEEQSNVGAIYCLAANPDNGFIFAVGGDKKEKNFSLLDLLSLPGAREKLTTSGNSATSSQIEEVKQDEMDTEDM